MKEPHFCFHFLNSDLNSVADSNNKQVSVKNAVQLRSLPFSLDRLQRKRNYKIDLLQRHQLQSLRHSLTNVALRKISKSEKEVLSLLPHFLPGAKLSSYIMSKMNVLVEFQFLIFCFWFSLYTDTWIFVYVCGYIINKHIIIMLSIIHYRSYEQLLPIKCLEQPTST